MIIDRRGTKPARMYESREKFKVKFKEFIKKSINKLISSSDIEESIKDQKLKLPFINKEINIYNSFDNFDTVFIGNTRYRKGDKIPKNQKGEASKGQQDGEDEFEFLITAEEFQNYLFEDLEIPNLERKNIADLQETILQHSGFTKFGLPSNLSIIRSFKQAIGRKLSLQSAFDKKIQDLEQELKLFKIDYKNANLRNLVKTDLELLETKIIKLKRLKECIPFIDNIDLRYKTNSIKHIPITKAVMICIMDVSGSMLQEDKDLAKRFYMLLYIFLSRKYHKKIELVFIRYHHEAEECNQKDFFYKKETGGTIIKHAIQLADKIISERYSMSEYNIYITHIGDGDILDVTDAQQSADIILENILPKLQHYIYLQIREAFGLSFSDWFETRLKSKKISFSYLLRVEDVYRIFRKIFMRRNKYD